MAKTAAANAESPLKNAKHEAVLQTYIGAPERVGYKAYLVVYPNSSDAAAKTGFSRLLKNAEFAARLSALDRKITERALDRAVMSAQEVLAELSKLGRSSIKSVIVASGDTGEVVQSLRDMADDHAATIKTLTIDTYMEGKGEMAREVRRVKLELHDKRGALRDLGQHHKLFTEKHELSGAGGGPVIFETVYEEPPKRRAKDGKDAAKRGLRIKV